MNVNDILLKLKQTLGDEINGYNFYIKNNSTKYEYPDIFARIKDNPKKILVLARSSFRKEYDRLGIVGESYLINRGIKLIPLRKRVNIG